MACARAKEALSEATSTTLDFAWPAHARGSKRWRANAAGGSAGDADEKGVVVTRREVSEAIGPLIERAQRLAESVISEAGVYPTDISEVVLVGGASRTPALRDMLKVQPTHAARAIYACTHGHAGTRTHALILLTHPRTLNRTLGVLSTARPLYVDRCRHIRCGGPRYPWSGHGWC